MASAFILPALKLTAALSGPLKRLFGSPPSPPATAAAPSAADVREDLDRLGGTMARIGAVLADAEERQIEDASVRRWLQEIRGLAHEAEDVLHEVEYAELRRTVIAAVRNDKGKAEPQGGGGPPPDPLEDPSFRDYLVRRVREFRGRSDEIESARTHLRLREEEGRRRTPSTAPPRPPAVGYPDGGDDSRAFGRGGDVDAVVGMLLSADYQDEDDGIAAVAVVGPDGVGKTTVAQLVFGHERVKRRFEIRSWVWASPEFDVVRLTREIVETVTGRSCDLDELSSLQGVLSERLAGKTILLVLDDVWNESQVYWEALRVSLLGAGEGSRILVTTASDKVARISGAPPAMHRRLQALTEEASWSLFCLHAFGEQNPDVRRRRIAKIGAEICRRCRGFPLSVKAVAELLRGEEDEQRWEELLAGDWEDLEEDGAEKTLPALQLGYHHLPPDLKRCFAYCAVLPRDRQFGKDQLLWMWVAQGFVQPAERKAAEDVAGECFEDLLRRSLFQEAPPDGGGAARRFMIHGAIRTLAQSLWEGESFRGEEPPGCKIARHHRHSSVVCRKLEALSPCEAAYNPGDLRTLILKLGTSDALRPDLLHGLFRKLRSVRVLDLSENGNISELPDSVGELKLLRFLGLSGTKVTRLPEAIGDLHSLQTMELRRCYSLTELPTTTGYLISLRLLDLRRSAKLRSMPRGIGRLTSIRTLPVFVVGREEDLPGEEGSGAIGGIAELADMNDLRGELHILGLQNVLYGRFDAMAAKMKLKSHLENLHLDWSGEECFDLGLAIDRAHDVLESLEPHAAIRELKLSMYRGLRFPGWMGSSSFVKLGKVTLIGCRLLTSVAPLGQLPALKSLEVQQMDGVRRLGREFFSGGGVLEHDRALFPALEALILHEMTALEEWLCWEAAAGGDFPRLRRLAVRRCPKLAALSLHNLRALRSLEVRSCGGLARINCLGGCPSADGRRDQARLPPCLETVKLEGDIPPASPSSSLHACRCPLRRKRKAAGHE